MTEMQYTCKFCGKPDTVEYDELCPPLKLEFWKSLLACNRCADFTEAKNKIEERILRTCGDLTSMNYIRDKSLKEEQEKDIDARERMRKALLFLTKRFAQLVCTHFHRPVTWEPDFVAILCDTPNKANLVLRQYVRDMSNTQRL